MPKLPLPRGPSGTRAAILGQIRSTLRAAPYAFANSGLTSRQLRVMRGQISVKIAIEAAKLEAAHFAHPERLYRMRDALADGQPITEDEILWLDRAIEAEFHGN